MLNRSRAVLAILLLVAASCGDPSGPDAGRIQIAAITTGTDVDLAYLAAVDDGPWQLLPASNGTVSVDHLAAGDHVVRIAGVATNCQLNTPAERTVSVPAGGMLLVPIGVSCSATVRHVLFGSTRDGAHDLYTMNDDGTNVVHITSVSNNLVYSASWSPDGSRIAYYTNRDGNYEIYVMNADGTNAVRLTSDTAFDGFPQWSPDGTKIAFESARQASTSSGALPMDIWIMNADGTGQTMIQRSGENPRWSPDGRRIVFDDSHALFIMNADGSNAVQLHEDPSMYSVEPAWSPDGTRIAFVGGTTGTSDEIYVVNADGSGVTALTQSAPGVVNDQPDWSPDGTRIAFRTNRDGDDEIYVMSANGSGQMSITPQFYSDEYAPAWRP
ncbi:MAG TPA: hypothetical protein VF166_08700 [Gemmatimonadaceae bacterium]